MRSPSLRSVALAAALGLAAAEGAARLLPLGLPDMADLHLEWALNAAPVFVVDDNGWAATAEPLQRLGNSPESFPARKEPGVLRILCVGDSTTAGWPYNPNGSYPRWLGAILADVRPDLKTEVINAGFHGFDSTRDLAVLRETLAYQPDVVVFKSGYNDAHLLAGRGSRLLSLRRALIARSQIFNALRRLRGRRPGGFDLQPREPRLTKAEEDRLAAAYASNLRAAAEEARGAHAALLFADLPSTGGRGNRFRGWTAMERLRAELREQAAALGAPLIDLSSVPRERFFDEIHCDAEGYRMIALATARALERSKALPEGRWRWERLRAPSLMAAEIGFYDPEYQAHLHDRLAVQRLLEGRRADAVAQLAAALRAAPNPGLVPKEIGDSRNADLIQALSEAQAMLQSGQGALAAKEVP